MRPTVFFFCLAAASLAAAPSHAKTMAEVLSASEVGNVPLPVRPAGVAR